MRVGIDTNIFLSIKNQEDTSPICEKIINSIENHEIEGSISTVVLAEMLVGFYQNNEEAAAKAFINKAQNNYQITLMTTEIAENSARLRAKQKIKLPDAIIYVSSLMNNDDYLISMDHPLLNREKKVISPAEFVAKFLQNSTKDE